MVFSVFLVKNGVSRFVVVLVRVVLVFSLCGVGSIWGMYRLLLGVKFVVMVVLRLMVGDWSWVEMNCMGLVFKEGEGFSIIGFLVYLVVIFRYCC